ncbi:TPA: hypothetical protein N0F65_008164 [Lagenidium giganteum]|uniref:Transmembrane protein 198 n=1 Tax=Lagenidium giganteum TaxID=4803 RepID=A0AAV2YJS7_9STRA|nr:TPA: hypothetical protein N0F65_008164 [Lagenidium giganteum]
MTTSSNPSRPTLLFAQLLVLLQCFCFATVQATAEAASDDVKSVFHMTDKIRIGPSVTAILAIVGGAIVCFFGYKLLRPAMFVCGFVVGGIFIASLIETAFKNKSWLYTASWVGFVVGGLIVGCLVVSIYNAGIFIAGAAAGVLLAFVINTSVGHKIYPSNPTLVLVILAVVLGIIGGILAIKIERPVLIIATSLVGSNLLVWGVGYFAGEYPNGADLKRFANEQSDGTWIYRIPGAWWGYLAGILVLWFLGMYMQFHKTGKQTHHRYGAQPRKRDNNDQYNSAQTPHHGNPVAHV